MSILGDSYEYDVFFSYAWATNTQEDALRDWCREIADKIRTLLRLRFNREEIHLNVYLDRDRTKSAQDLNLELEAATRRSAIFVAMVSDHYASPWCQKEADWFCSELTETSFPERVCILKVQKVGDGKWPRQMTTKDGDQRKSIDFCDAHGQPKNMAEFLETGKISGLADKVNEAVVEIAEKIAKIQQRISARAAYAASQRLPNEPLMFLEAEQTDLEKWLWCKTQLLTVPSIPWPIQAPVPATAPEADSAYAGCEALLLLRSRIGDDINNRIKAAYLYRRGLLSGEKEVPGWALLDEFDEPPPAGPLFKVPHVPLKGDWIPALRAALLNP